MADGDARIALFSDVATALSSAGSVDAVMRSLVATLVPALGDGCEVALPDADGTLHRIALVEAPGDWQERERIPVPDFDEHPVHVAMRSGATQLLRLHDPSQAHLFGPADVPSSSRALGVHTALVAPLQGRERVLGTLGLGLVRPDRTWDDADVSFLTSVGRLAGLALENIAALDHERDAARTLQAALLPSALPSIPGIEVGAHYWPAGTGLDVGGDFYDVFAVGEGRWTVVIGDVCGKGVEAAVVTSAARHTARAAAIHLGDPALVLRWVHDALLGGGRFCTVACGVLDLRAPATPTFRVALGGHPQPIRVTAAGDVEHLGRPGTLLGLLEPHIEDVEHALDPGDLVVLFTDGITDVPEPTAMTVEELGQLLVSVRERSLDEIGERLRDVLRARRPEGFRDDVALVLLRVAA